MERERPEGERDPEREAEAVESGEKEPGSMSEEVERAQEREDELAEG